jgi:hypothetical protein
VPLSWRGPAGTWRLLQCTAAVIRQTLSARCVHVVSSVSSWYMLYVYIVCFVDPIPSIAISGTSELIQSPPWRCIDGARVSHIQIECTSNAVHFVGLFSKHRWCGICGCRGVVVANLLRILAVVELSGTCDLLSEYHTAVHRSG